MKSPSIATRNQLRIIGEAVLRIADGEPLDSDWITNQNRETTNSTDQDRSRSLLTVTEAADQLRISRWSLYQLINRQQIATITIGRRRLVPATEIERFVGSLAATGGVQ